MDEAGRPAALGKTRSPSKAEPKGRGGHFLDKPPRPGAYLTNSKGVTYASKTSSAVSRQG